MSRYGMWKPYVPVAKRRAAAAKKMAKLKAKGADIQPVAVEGRTIARSFWGKAWCEHLESYSDYANRLPRGRTYVRNGSVCHLGFSKGALDAMVSGSEIYKISAAIRPLPAAKWKRLKTKCAGRIGSLIELLQGDLSDELMAVVTDRQDGLFPDPREIDLRCNCPDWADLCKHLAAVLYAVGARLDEQPELLFLLRGVDHEELIETGADAVLDGVDQESAGAAQLASEDLSDIFGIDLATAEDSVPEPTPKKKKAARPRKKKTATKAKKKAPPKPRAQKKKPNAAAKKKAAPKKRKTARRRK